MAKLILDPKIVAHLDRYDGIFSGLLALEMIPMIGETFRGPRDWCTKTPRQRNIYMLKRLGTTKKHRQDYIWLTNTVSSLIDANVIYWDANDRRLARVQCCND
jgi:hypothetical protein